MGFGGNVALTQFNPGSAFLMPQYFATAVPAMNAVGGMSCQWQPYGGSLFMPNQPGRQQNARLVDACMALQGQVKNPNYITAVMQQDSQSDVYDPFTLMAPKQRY
jgi:hypothetical protein